jgi:hypothetical protein
MPRKIPKAAKPFFKTEKPEVTSNKTSTNSVINERRLKVQQPLNPESLSSLASQETALRPLLIFYIAGRRKNASSHIIL